MELSTPLTGDELKNYVWSEEKPREIYSDGFLHEQCAVMVSADPGTGKSMLMLQAALQLSSGMPLFGGLTVAKPRRVYYIQKERPPIEVKERIRVFSEVISINWDNIIVDSKLQKFNLSNLANVNFMIARIKPFKPELIVIDPIGAGTPGLSKDEIANNFASFLTSLQTELGNAFLLSHHTSRAQYAQQTGEKIEKEKPFYGSQWIDAFITGHYHLTKNENGTAWRKTKDNYNLLINKMKMTYEPDTYCSFMSSDSMLLKDRVLNYINSVKSFKKTFTFNELHANLGCVVDSLRHTLNDRLFLDKLKRHKSSGKPTLYEIL